MAITIDHEGKAVLVTGAGAGIGRQIARWMARAGAAVAVNDVRADNARSVVAEIEAEGGRAIPVVADCRDDDEARGMVATVVKELGGLDIAFNNIGMLPKGRTVKPFVEYRRRRLARHRGAEPDPRRPVGPGRSRGVARPGPGRSDHLHQLRRDHQAVAAEQSPMPPPRRPSITWSHRWPWSSGRPVSGSWPWPRDHAHRDRPLRLHRRARGRHRGVNRPAPHGRTRRTGPSWRVPGQ